MVVDYAKAGLKAGIEIHQQLDTQRKLFCGCRARLAETAPVRTVIRRLRAVSGETGEIDVAATREAARGREFEYLVYSEESCDIEMDEEPPRPVNREALETGLLIAKMLHCTIPDEIEVMRKTVIDGSNTSGFQRTALIGFDGWFDTSFGKVGITNVNLEEESAQIKEQKEGRITYGLDRLGIPLVEIGTTADMHTPQQVREAAATLGLLLQSTGRVKRGLGTIRQDVNVSVAAGNRVEIKGAQSLSLLEEMVTREAERQLGIVRLHLNGAAHGKVNRVAELFVDSNSFFRGKEVYATLFPGLGGVFAGRLGGRTLGNEVAGFVKVSGFRGFVHSDEDVGKYKMIGEMVKVREHLNCTGEDLAVLFSGTREEATRCFGLIQERLRQLAGGVTKDTRKALESGDTDYLRPLPGAARLYPETDLGPVEVDKKAVEKLKLPESMAEKKERLVRRGLNEELAGQLIREGAADIFEEITKNGVEPTLAAVALTGLKTEVERELKKELGEERMKEIFNSLKGKPVDKTILKKMFSEALAHPEKRAEGLIGGGGMEESEIRTIIKNVLENTPGIRNAASPESALMGLVMRELRGRAGGAAVMTAIREALKK